MPGEIELRVYPDELFVYHDRSLLVTDRDGWIGGGISGLYEHEFRLLSRYRLLINGKPPRLDALARSIPIPHWVTTFARQGWTRARWMRLASQNTNWTGR